MIVIKFVTNLIKDGGAVMKLLFPMLLGVATGIIFSKLIGKMNDKYIAKNNVKLPLKIKICVYTIQIIVIVGIIFLFDYIFNG